MIVKDLIEQLKKCPEHLTVLIANDNLTYDEVDTIGYTKVDGVATHCIINGE